MATFNVEIVTPHKVVYTGEAQFVKLRTVLGDMGIQPNHAPLVSELVLGEMIVRAQDKTEEVFYISGGFLEIQHNKTLILADDAMNVKNIDKQRAEKEAEELKAKISKIQEEQEMMQAEKLLREALMKVNLSQR